MAGQKILTPKDAVLVRLKRMKNEEREELFEEILDIYCVADGFKLDDDGDCPNPECPAEAMLDDEDDEDDDGDDDEDLNDDNDGEDDADETEDDDGDGSDDSDGEAGDE